MDRSLQKLVELSLNLQGITHLRTIREIGAQLERIEAPH